MNKLTVVFIILTPLILLLFSTHTLVFDEDTYATVLESANNYNSSTINTSRNIIDYFRTSDYVIPTISGMTNDETTHLLDVKVIIHALIAFYIAIVLLALFLYEKIDFSKIAIFGSGLTIVSIMLFALGPFNTIFVAFHQIFFKAETWTFPASSLLIQTYPSVFFYNFMMRILLQTIILTIALLLGGMIYYKYLKKKSSLNHNKA